MERKTYTATAEGIEKAEKALNTLGFASQILFAKSINVARNIVTKFFNTSSGIQPDTFQRICQHLNLNWEEIAGIKPEKEPQPSTTQEPNKTKLPENQTKETIKKTQITLLNKQEQTIKANITFKSIFSSKEDTEICANILKDYSGNPVKIEDTNEGITNLYIEASTDEIHKLISNIKTGELRAVNSLIIDNIQIDKWDLVKIIINKVEPFINEDLFQNIDLTDVDLSFTYIGNTDLTETDLSDADLSDTNLTRANLTNADLSKTSLIRANLTRTYLIDAYLREADLKDANLSRANLTRANLRGVNLIRANIQDADLTRANLREADLKDANLSRANLSRANLREVNFSGANLSRANLSDVNLSNANLKGANLSDVDLGDAYLSDADLSDCDLNFTNFRDANLSGVNLTHASLIRANLIRVNLSDANLIGTNLNRVNLSDACLIDANLIRANLTDINLSGAKVKNCRFGNNTGMTEFLKEDLIQRGAIFYD